MTTYSKETALYDTGAIATDIGTAGNTAKGYMTNVSNAGVFVHEYDTSEPQPTDTGENGVHIHDSVDIISDGDIVASYGDDAVIGKKNDNQIIISNRGIVAVDPNKGVLFDVHASENTAQTERTEYGRTFPKTLSVTPITGTSITVRVRESINEPILYTINFVAGTAATIHPSDAPSIISVTYDGEKTFTGECVLNDVKYTAVVNGSAFTLGTRNTIAREGITSATFGENLIAGSNNQVVIGRLNVPDYNNKYPFIVGCGSDSQGTYANGLTVDWNGNVRAYRDFYTNMGQISLGTYITGGVLTGNGSYMHFSIPTGRVFPDGTTISKLMFNIVVRAGNHNASGLYIVKNASGGTDVKYYDSTASFQFYNGANQSKTLTTAMSDITLQGGTNIYVSWHGSGDYFFSGTSTYNGYVNNQPIVIMLTNITANLNIPS